ncbi:MAG: SpoIID/LytB domain-containing protein [Balneolaceae bacterium]|nr:MAG: SpoIID/LytB domain-containing protein [Balneolaceae bacterium]
MLNSQAVYLFILVLLTVASGSRSCGGQAGGDARSGADPVFTDEPVVRVLILDTTERITLIPHDDWRLTSEGHSETWGPGDGPLDLSAVSGRISISRMGSGGSTSAAQMEDVPAEPRLVSKSDSGTEMHTDTDKKTDTDTDTGMGIGIGIGMESDVQAEARIILPEDMQPEVLTFEGVRDSATLLIRDVPYGVGWWWEGKEDRIYEGRVHVYAVDGDRLQVVVELPLERYLKGVVPYEIGGDSPMEALKAQAVAARSEAVRALTTGLYSGPNYDLTSDVESQVFSGNHRRTDASDRAVDETESLILSANGQPVNAYYASNCGGHSELIRNVWPDRPDPLTYHNALRDSDERVQMDLSNEVRLKEWIHSEPDVFCNPALEPGLPGWSRTNFRWQREFTGDEISSTLAGLCNSDCGRLVDIVPLKRGPSGRMYEARFDFEHGSIIITGELAIRQLFRPSLRSSAFISTRDGDTWILNGAGWGHGVGMCQSGAVAQALQGRDFITILMHYYPDTQVLRSY